MITAAELAGFMAAHAIWCVSDGELLIPMLAYTNEDDERQLERMAHDDLSAAVEHGQQRLASNEMDANDATLLYDGRISADGDTYDAIIVEVRAYFSPDSMAVIAVPYTPKSSGRFRVHKPQVLVWENCEDFDLDQAMSSFFNGVGGHEKGAEVWGASLDDSDV